MIKEFDIKNNKSIFISATNTDVGKTYASEVFLKYFAKQGLKVGYFKPIETGVIDKPIDGCKMLSIVKELNPDFKANINDIVPYQFKLPAAPYIAKEDTQIDIDFLIEKKQYLQNMCNILVCEGAGGLMVPIQKDFFIIDLIKAFKSKCILITPSNLGCINDTLLSTNTLRNQNIDFDFYINLYKDKENFNEVSLPFLEDYFKNIKFLHNLSTN